MQIFFLNIYPKKYLRIFRLFYIGVWYYILNIDFPESKNAREVKVFNMAGQLIYSNKTSNSSIQIDFQSLNIKGNLILQVLDGESVSNHKIIIK